MAVGDPVNEKKAAPPPPTAGTLNSPANTFFTFDFPPIFLKFSHVQICQGEIVSNLFPPGLYVFARSLSTLEVNAGGVGQRGGGSQPLSVFAPPPCRRPRSSAASSSPARRLSWNEFQHTLKGRGFTPTQRAVLYRGLGLSFLLGGSHPPPPRGKVPPSPGSSHLTTSVGKTPFTTSGGGDNLVWPGPPDSLPYTQLTGGSRGKPSPSPVVLSKPWAPSPPIDPQGREGGGQPSHGVSQPVSFARCRGIPKGAFRNAQLGTTKLN